MNGKDLFKEKTQAKSMQCKRDMPIAFNKEVWATELVTIRSELLT
jgi:hypothetical protein